MENNNTGIAIFNQICEVNELDPDKIREVAQKQQPAGQSNNTDEAELLIRTAFSFKAKALTRKLELGSTSDSDNISDGEEYSIGADSAAPSFIINEDFINNKYSEDEARRLIDALGKIRLPIRA